MIKKIISKKISFLLKSNQFSAVRNGNEIITISKKFFARREINKSLLLSNMNTFLRDKKESSRNISKNKLGLHNDSIKNQDISSVLKNFSSSVKLNKPINFEKVDFKEFYLDILNSLSAENIEINILDNWLNLIEIKYFSEQQIKNIGFKLLLLIDQLFNNHSIENYRNKYNNTFINSGFDHLMDLFKENFYQINKNGEDLLINNFLFFMLTNKGELSDLFKLLSGKSQKFKDNLERILSVTFKMQNEISDSKLNYNFFLDYELNNKNAPSTITNDYSYKFRDLNNKTSLYNNLIIQKQNIYKIKFLVNSSNQLKNDLSEDLNEIEKIISAFLLKEVKDIVNDDLIKIQDELSKCNKIIEQYSSFLTDLKIVNYNRVNVNNIENVYSPFFSGEKNIHKQYIKVSKILGGDSAKKLYDLFLIKLNKQNSYTFKDVFNMNLIWKNKNIPLENKFFNIFIEPIEKEKGLESLQISNKRPFNLSKQEKMIFVEVKNSLNSILNFSSKINKNIEKPQPHKRNDETVQKRENTKYVHSAINSNKTFDSLFKESFKKNDSVNHSNLDRNYKERSNETVASKDLNKQNYIEQNVENISKNTLLKDRISGNKSHENITKPIEGEKNEYETKKIIINKSQQNNSLKENTYNKESNKLNHSPVKFEKMNDIKDIEVDKEKKKNTIENETTEIKQNQHNTISEETIDEQQSYEQEIQNHPLKNNQQNNYSKDSEVKTETELKLDNEIENNQIKLDGLQANKIKLVEDKDNLSIDSVLKDNKDEKIDEEKTIISKNSMTLDNTETNKKSEEFITMEEKFKKQKMKKFYYNDNKNYHYTIIKNINRNYSSSVLNDSFSKDISKSSNPNSNSTNIRTRSLTQDKSKMSEESFEDSNQEIKNRNYFKIKSSKIEDKKIVDSKEIQSSIKFTRIQSPLKNSQNSSFEIERKLSDVEGEPNILNFLEKEDELLNKKIDLSSNNNIIVESNQEVCDISINYWINFFQKNRKEKDLEKMFEIHLIQKFRYIII